MKTRFDITLKLRIALDGCGKDKFTKDFILSEIRSGDAVIQRGDLCNFIVWTKNNNQIMAEVEKIHHENPKFITKN